MKAFQMVALTNVLFVAILALLSLLWPLIGAIVYNSSWWIAPLAAFGGFFVAGRVVRATDHDQACRLQIAVMSIFCFGVLIWSLLIQNLGIPAWRVVLTLALASAGTWLSLIALGRMR